MSNQAYFTCKTAFTKNELLKTHDRSLSTHQPHNIITNQMKFGNSGEQRIIFKPK